MQQGRTIANYFFRNSSKIIPAVLDETNLNYVLKFDGCSKGNPGPAGAGAVLYYNELEVWAGKKLVGRKETNNCAEYCGLILGLQEAAKKNIRGLKVCGDSLLVIKQMKGEYKVNSDNLLPLYNEAKNLESTFEKIVYEHIYRQYNTRADELANDALEQQEFLDEVKSGFK